MAIAFNTALSALNAFDVKLDVNANNIANVNTDGFKSSRVYTQESAEGGVTVSIEKNNSPGVTVGVNEATGEDIESSNVNMAEELVDQMVTRYAFEANTVTVKTVDQMQQTLLDIFS